MPGDPGRSLHMSLVGSTRAWKRTTAITAAIFLAPVVAACGSTTATSGGPTGTVTIALNTTLSGSFGFFGLANQNALKLAVEQLNNSGGLLGKTVNLEIKDDTAAAAVASDETRTEVLNDHIVALFGPVSSSVALAEQTLAGKYKIPFIVHTSNTDKLTVKSFNDFTFSVVPNTGMEGRANAIAAAQLPYTKYYLIGPDYEFGHSQLAAFKSQMMKLRPDVTFVGEDYPKLGATDYSTYISKIEAAHPEIVYSAEFAGDLITFLTQGKSAGIVGADTSPKLMGLFDVDTLRNLGATAPTGAYAYGRAPFFAITTPAMKTFVDAFQARYNIPPSDWAVMAYDAFTLWVDGVKKANSFDGMAVSQAMSGMTFDSTRGMLTVRAIDHQVDCSEYEGVLQKDTTVGFETFANATAETGSQILLSPDQVTAIRNGG
jgi:branched-chain amino acid transport system substrate-binding protein